MTQKIRLENIAIVLLQPRVSENIGAAARAMCNMGIRRLLVVAPKALDMERVERMATHAAMDAVRNMVVVDSLPEALSGFTWVVGTTARLGGDRQVIPSPGRLMDSLIPVSAENQVAILFGPEDRGLTNEDLMLCHEVVTIPTADFSSLNLAQAVMVICYELFKTSRDELQSFAPRLATRYELDGMYEQLKDILIRIDYINKEKPDYWMNKIRYFFSRLQLRAREVGIIRGICRQIDWYAGKCYREGITAGDRSQESVAGSRETEAGGREPEEPKNHAIV